MLNSGKYQGLYGLIKIQTMARPNSPLYFPESRKNPADYIKNDYSVLQGSQPLHVNISQLVIVLCYHYCCLWGSNTFNKTK